MVRKIYFDKNGKQQPDPWMALGLNPGAKSEAIHSRYRELIKVHSPEKDPDKFIELNEAFQRLTHPDFIMERLFGQIELKSPAELGLSEGCPAKAGEPGATKREIPENWLAGEMLLYAMSSLLGLKGDEDLGGASQAK